MNPILYTAAGSANKAILSQHVRSNNMANSNTTGFKAVLERSTPIFRGGDGFETSTTSRSNSTGVDFSAGELTRTGRALDLAINGNGFFAVLDDQGNESYTRAGNVTASKNGTLMVNNRDVLDENGAPIVLPIYQDLNISEKGIVNIVPNGGGASVTVAKVKLVNPSLENLTLNKGGTFDSNVPLESDSSVIMASGYLESSNVSPITEMMAVMMSTRQYEIQVKMMKAADKLAASGNQLVSARG
ncbi:flagellar basal body rod protein FlgF [Psychromonas sp. Urea-02u-13]|uniref:flagellar basal body rod protein FlgF n=1 Tax=Psychromonas sp. Urea-02u-13 TaxID=2058326 RepID=UPI000C33E24C|nr:flagellar basal body rod protein FlgF [Psychromonas sp. Urea-02u-13]PKG39531.1 flagellar biosynthesis protein FlgF [Psychromonas sp. Urea-02u-13]